MAGTSGESPSGKGKVSKVVVAVYRGSLPLPSQVPLRSDQASWKRLCRIPNVVSSSRAMARSTRRWRGRFGHVEASGIRDAWRQAWRGDVAAIGRREGIPHVSVSAGDVSHQCKTVLPRYAIPLIRKSGRTCSLRVSERGLRKGQLPLPPSDIFSRKSMIHLSALGAE